LRQGWQLNGALGLLQKRPELSTSSSNKNYKPAPLRLRTYVFSDEFDDSYDLAIIPAWEAAGAYPEQVEKQFSLMVFWTAFTTLRKPTLPAPI
jgi:hypothetical protein